MIEGTLGAVPDRESTDEGFGRIQTRNGVDDS